MEKVRGVNLGNWIVLEKWMSPDLWVGTEAEDEDTLCRVLPREELAARLTKHRDSWVTAEDFRLMAEAGLNMVRLPVPHFVFGDDPAFCDPYVPCIEYVDRAFDWAEQVGMKVLLDLHTVPDSANGFDNGGICGVCKWHQKPENIERSLKVLELLAERYKGRPGLFGIQPVNEPANERIFAMTASRYQPYDPARAAGSSAVPTDVLKQYYEDAYRRLRAILGDEPWIVLHDGFRIDEFYGFMAGDEYKNVMFDTHMYVGMGMAFGAVGQMERRLAFFTEVSQNRAKLARMEETRPIIVGEWNSAHPLDRNGEYTAAERKFSYQAALNEQLFTNEHCGSGWVFWSYRNDSEFAKPAWSWKDQYLAGNFPKL